MSTLDDRLLTPREVADMFRVDPKTVTRWGKAGRITLIKTLGGHSRFLEREVHALLKRNGLPQSEADAEDSSQSHSTNARSSEHDRGPTIVRPRNNRGW